MEILTVVVFILVVLALCIWIAYLRGEIATLKLYSKLTFNEITKWQNSFAQYVVGDMTRDEAKNLLAEQAGIAIYKDKREAVGGNDRALSKDEINEAWKVREEYISNGD